LRDRGNWAAYVALPVIAGVVLAVTTGVGTQVWQWFTGPPKLSVSKPMLGSCPQYFEGSLSELKSRKPRLPLSGGVVVTARGDDPANMIVTLQAGSSQAIVVTGLKVHVLSSRSMPASGTVVHGECGGGMTPRRFDVEFARNSASVTPVKPETGPTVGFPLKISDSDPEQLELRLLPGERDVRFAVEIEWISAGQSSRTVLDNDGAGFRVMGEGDLPVHEYADLVR
jgi:hypothetical protein